MTDASGAYRFTGLAAGALTVRASKAEYDPVDRIITLKANQKADFELRKSSGNPPPPVGPVSIVFSSAAVDDHAGNGNGRLDIDECALLLVSLRNNGATDATNVTSTLTTRTPGVTITSPTSAYPSIPSGATKSNVSPFGLRTSPSFAGGTPIALALDVTTAQGHFSVTFNLPSGSGGPSVIFASASGPISIPDNNGNGATLNVFVSGAQSSITKVELTLFIDHPSVGDLIVSLIAPDGTTVVLANHRGGGGRNFGTDCPAGAGDTSFDDAASRPVGSGSAPFIGAWSPDQPLAAFKGKPASVVNGVWRLRVVDSATGGAGRIGCVQLGFDLARSAGCSAPLTMRDLDHRSISESFASRITDAARVLLAPDAWGARVGLPPTSVTGYTVSPLSEPFPPLHVATCTVRKMHKCVPDAVLFKPGPLTVSEYDVMKRHPIIGQQLCTRLRSL